MERAEPSLHAAAIRRSEPSTRTRGEAPSVHGRECVATAIHRFPGRLSLGDVSAMLRGSSRAHLPGMNATTGRWTRNIFAVFRVTGHGHSSLAAYRINGPE